MTWFAILVVPLVIAAVAWFAIYMIAYDLGPLQATGVGLLQILIGWGVGVLLRAIGWVATSGPPPI